MTLLRNEYCPNVFVIIGRTLHCRFSVYIFSHGPYHYIDENNSNMYLYFVYKFRCNSTSIYFLGNLLSVVCSVDLSTTSNRISIVRTSTFGTRKKTNKKKTRDDENVKTRPTVCNLNRNFV